jgi:hypothetical protein
MKYFQTDDRDDYFASLENGKSKNPCISVSLLDANGKIILSQVPTYRIRNFVKNTYPEFGNARKVWRQAIQSKGYTVVNNY